MKNKYLTSLLTTLLLLICFDGISQNTIPEVKIRTIDGEPVLSSSFVNGGNPYLICFWKSCCNSSLKFMEALNEVYPDLVDEYNIKVFAVAIDDSRTSNQVKPLVNGNIWEFDFFLDENQELARAMNINLTPHCIIYDGNNIPIWQKSVCMEGDEAVIEEEISKIEN